MARPHPGWGLATRHPPLSSPRTAIDAQGVLCEKNVTFRPQLSVRGQSARRRRREPGIDSARVRDLRNRLGSRAASTAIGSPRCRRRSRTAGPTRRARSSTAASGSRRGGSRSSTSTAGDQPISNEDGTCTVVQNGEIYNYRELRASSSAPGHRFRTRSRHRGARPRLRGVGPRRSRSGCAGCSRSRSGTRRGGGSCSRATAFGIKPLYYRDVGGELSFASELDALPRGELDLDALEAFLAFNSIPAPLSIFREIRKLPAGPRARLGGRARRARALRAARARCRRGTTRDEAELVEECRARLRDSVRAHLVADVPGRRAPLGRRRLGRARRARGARRARSRCGRSRSASRRRRSTSWPARARSRRATARGTASSSCGPTRRCSCRRSPTRSTSRSPTRRRCRPTSSRKLAAEDVKVALSGEGGDELFGGYYTYVADLLAERVGAARARSRGRASSGCRRRRARASFDYRAKRFVRAAHLPPLERHHGWKEIFSADARAELTGRRHGWDPVVAPARALRRDRGPRAARRGCRTSTSASTSSTTCS